MSITSKCQIFAEIRIGSNSDCDGWGLDRISKEAYGRVGRLFITLEDCNFCIFLIVSYIGREDRCEKNTSITSCWFYEGR